MKNSIYIADDEFDIHEIKRTRLDPGAQLQAYRY